jgi:hypothetical protein
MTVFTWRINQLDRNTKDGWVNTAHYSVDAVDGDFVANTYGTVSFEHPDDAVEHAPYDQLTEQMVVGWVQTSLGKDVVEASLQGQIEAQKHPVQESGLPWVAA